MGDARSVAGARTRALVRSFYAPVGGLFLVAGVGVLLFRTGLLPDAVRDRIEGLGRSDLNTLHIAQEFSSLLVFAGLISFWFVWHYDQSRAFHWAMTAFWGLVALVHWFDVRGSFQYGAGQVVNTAPFAVFAAAGLLRQASERRAGPG